MAKPTSAKPSGSSSSSTKAAKKDKVAKAPVEAATAPAASKKSSLKRKSDANDDVPSSKAAKATTTTATEEAVKAPSPKKSKTTATASPAAKTRVPTKPPTGLELRKHQRKTAEAIEKAKGPHSRRKQAEPKPIKGAVASDAEDEDEEMADVEEVKKVEVKKVEAPKAEAKKGKGTSKKDKDAERAAVEKQAALEDMENEISEDEEETHLHGFSTDEDSSDEDDDDMDAEPSAFDVAKLPTIDKDDTTVKKKLEKAKRNPTGERGVLFLGRIPHGFYEEQMKAYFSQFGDVTRIRLSRNKKTGKSKHYGFVEFDSASVAKIVADTMDNYLMNGHIMQCKLIPKDKVHPQLWVGANRKWRTVPPEQLTRATHNKKRDGDEQYAASRRLIKRQNQRKRKLEELGINYDFEGAGYNKVAKVAAE
ncbi:hypothetical protein DFP72DRAFT_1068397 [Ephemerocybe angulata]|uniref:RRM domain-containing protein n=1 Tax=Ephemerocybe angulata TaxID=980116 RepID=A0A8H6M6X0_9AGAR|nr:hypothetical protein DFP72DRAFT_1068397 [Tulosesus angulatus]